MNRLMMTTLLSLALMVGVSQTPAAAAEKVKKSRPVQGVVTEIVSKANGETAVTVKLKAKKKADTAATAAVEKRFTITKTTALEQLTGKKGQVANKKAEIGELKKDAQVQLTVAANGTVEKLTIQSKGKKKPKAT